MFRPVGRVLVPWGTAPQGLGRATCVRCAAVVDAGTVVPGAGHRMTDGVNALRSVRGLLTSAFPGRTATVIANPASIGLIWSVRRCTRCRERIREESTENQTGATHVNPTNAATSHRKIADAPAGPAVVMARPAGRSGSRS